MRAEGNDMEHGRSPHVFGVAFAPEGQPDGRRVAGGGWRVPVFAPEGLLIVARDFSPWVVPLKDDPSRRDGRKGGRWNGPGTPYRRVRPGVGCHLAMWRAFSQRPYGTHFSFKCPPGTKVPGYSQSSLRDCPSGAKTGSRQLGASVGLGSFVASFRLWHFPGAGLLSIIPPGLPLRGGGNAKNKGRTL